MRNSLFCLLFSLLTLISCKHKLEEPYSFFGNRNLGTGNFKLVGTGLEGEHIEGFDNFYIDDAIALQAMQKQWIFEYSTKVMACGFGYELKLMQDSVVINKGLLNLECGYFNTDDQNWIHFPRNFLTDHMPYFKSIPSSK